MRRAEDLSVLGGMFGAALSSRRANFSLVCDVGLALRLRLIHWSAMMVCRYDDLARVARMVKVLRRECASKAQRWSYSIAKIVLKKMASAIRACAHEELFLVKSRFGFRLAR